MSHRIPAEKKACCISSCLPIHLFTVPTVPTWHASAISSITKSIPRASNALSLPPPPPPAPPKPAVAAPPPLLPGAPSPTRPLPLLGAEEEAAATGTGTDPCPAPPPPLLPETCACHLGRSASCWNHSRILTAWARCNRKSWTGVTGGRTGGQGRGWRSIVACQSHFEGHRSYSQQEAPTAFRCSFLRFTERYSAFFLRPI